MEPMRKRTLAKMYDGAVTAACQAERSRGANELQADEIVRVLRHEQRYAMASLPEPFEAAA